MPTPAPNPPAASSRRRWGCTAALLLMIALGAAGLVVYVLLRSTPSYVGRYHQFISQTTPQQRADLAANLEAKFSAILSPERPSDAELRLAATAPGMPAGPSPGIAPTATGPAPPAPAATTPATRPGDDVRVLTVSVAEANAWLTERFPQWAANRKWHLPPEILAPKVGLDDGRLLLGLRFESPKLSEDATLVFRPELLPDGKLRLALESIRGGRLPVPLRGTLTGQMRDAAGTQKSTDLRTLASTLEGEPFDPVWPMPPGRTTTGRLIGFEMLPEGVRVVVRVEHGDEKR